jgi:hypothetical protein
MMTYGGLEVCLQALLISALDGRGQLHAPATLPPGKEHPVPIV